MTTYQTLVLGASYGSLLGTKLAAARHTVRLVCLPAEAELINEAGTIVRLPVRGRAEAVELRSRELPGALSAGGPGDFDPAEFDLVVLAMQEPQYRAPGVRELLAAVARSGRPCMSVMNMPPLPYLERLPALDGDTLRGCYADATVWSGFDPRLMTLASPDPQAFRPPQEPVNVLEVGLATNFKVARFDADAHTAILRRMQSDIESYRHETADGPLALPVKLKVHDSLYVPLAKWSMLLAGNYRCVRGDRMRSIQDAVHGDLDRSRSVYDWVGALCRELGAAASDLVPFEKYAEAARGLRRPSSAARALAAGATDIERTDRLVQTIAAQRGMRNAIVDETVALVDAWLERNRGKARAAS